MTDPGPEPSVMPGQNAAPWGRYTAIMAALGAASVFVINEWARVEPVLESPSVIVLAMLAVFGLGGLSAYWLLTRPHEDRLRRAELVINRLRAEAREYLVERGDLLAKVAALDATVVLLREDMNALRRELDAARAPPRRTRTPKPKGEDA